MIQIENNRYLDSEVSRDEACLVTVNRIAKADLESSTTWYKIEKQFMRNLINGLILN